MVIITIHDGKDTNLKKFDFVHELFRRYADDEEIVHVASGTPKLTEVSVAPPGLPSPKPS